MKNSISILKLSDVYRQKLAKSAELDLNSNNEANLNKRDHMRERAWMLGSDAGRIAHCIAFFGDLSVSAAVALLDDPEAMAKIPRRCCGENPWLRELNTFASAIGRVTASDPQQPQSGTE